MKKTALLALTFILTAFTTPGKKKIRIFMAGDSTMAIKETKAFPETGWGMPFVHFWDSSVTVVNRAKNGRSSKSFISEGLWKSITDEMSAGDYVFIQFGHNDESVSKKEQLLYKIVRYFEPKSILTIGANASEIEAMNKKLLVHQSDSTTKESLR